MVKNVISGEDFRNLRKCLEGILIKEELINYIVDIVRETRSHESILVGAGPRATQALILASRAYAALQGRDFVIPDDIKLMANPVMEHRMLLRADYEIEGLTIIEVIQTILNSVSVPR